MASLDHGERWGGEHHVAYLDDVVHEERWDGEHRVVRWDDGERVERLACVGYGAC